MLVDVTVKRSCVNDGQLDEKMTQPEDMDPLDAYMATLHDGGDAPTVPPTTADARAAARVYRDRQTAAATSVETVVRNRRYSRLQQLLGEKDTTQHEGDWYFSDEQMQQRSPALFHLHLGQYLNVASREQRAPFGADGVSLSAFLMDTCDRQVMEARRVAEQRTWGKYRSVDDHAEEEEEEKEEEEEEEEEEEDEDEETKEQESEPLGVDERRAQLIDLMCERFLDGFDTEFVDYATIDSDQGLDDMDQMQRDAEERYFAEDE